MSNKRTQVLFDSKTFSFLAALASKKNTSVGELIRRAVSKVYLEERTNQDVIRKIAFEKILRLKRNIKPISNKEIKEFINYGR